MIAVVDYLMDANNRFNAEENYINSVMKNYK
jgi:hypothetical protein